MRRIKYLHFMPDSIYSLNFSNRVNEVYESGEHLFIIYGCGDVDKYDKRNVKAVDKVGIKLLWQTILIALEARQIYIHGLFLAKKEIIVTAILSIILKNKYSWYIWSSDCIREHEAEQNIHGLMLKRRIKRLCRKIIIRNLQSIIVTAHSDYEYAVNHYKTKAKEIHAFYAYNLPEKILNVETEKLINGRIMAGHSAAKTNHHKKLYDDIKKTGYEGEIVSILSYDAEQSYINKVKKYGMKMFGEKFYPILEYSSYDKYIDLLMNIDAGIFYGKCQNGAGNIMYLLYLGKKVFLAPENGSFSYLLEKGVKVFGVDDINRENLEKPLSEEEITKNRNIIAYLCSNIHFKEEWDCVFEI